MKKTVIKPFFPPMTSAIEKWLTQMALNGFTLVSNNGWKFVFIESSPKSRKYCIYSGFDASKGIWSDYYLAKKLCCNTKTKLSNDTYGIFEIDTKKENQILYHFKNLRKKHYIKHYCSLFLLTLFFSVILFILSYLNNSYIVVLVFCLAFTFYYLVSLFVVLICDKTK